MARNIEAEVWKAITATMRKPFRWGLRTDCTVACEAFRLIHGVDPLIGCKATYGSALGAARILKKAGGYASWCGDLFTMPETSEARSGDLALISSGDTFGLALAICIKSGEFAAKTERGLVVTKSSAQRAWTWHFSHR